MFSQFFGQYLLEKGLLSPAQIRDALEYERSIHVKLGIIAMNAGYMNAAQVEEINLLQMRMDRKFGELAVERNYLTVGQLETLLTMQRQKHLSFSQALIERGYLSLNQLEDALEGYRNNHGFSADQMQALTKLDYDETAHLLLDFSAVQQDCESYYDYVSLTLRNIVRFLNDQPVISRNTALAAPLNGWVASQKITGEVSIYTALHMDDEVLMEVAKRFSGENLSKIDELTKDCIAEFLNVNNGLFNVNFSNQRSDLELLPQSIRHTESLEIPNAHSIPITLSFGTMNLILAPCQG